MKIGDKLKHNESGKCLHCGEPVSLRGDRYPLYCPGLVCKKAYEEMIRHSKRKSVICLICGSEFIKAKTIGLKYCSPKCAYQGSLALRSDKPKLKVCQHCGSDYKPYSTLDKFCSSSCRIANMKSKRTFNRKPESAEKISGIKNPCYRNGMYTRTAKRSFKGHATYIANRDNLKAKMIEGYGFLFCEHCGVNNSMFWETHHIIYRSEKPWHPNLHDKPNLLHLCMQCHNDFHKSKDMRNAIVVERGLDKIFGQDVLDKMSAEERRERGLLTTKHNQTI